MQPCASAPSCSKNKCRRSCNAFRTSCRESAASRSSRTSIANGSSARATLRWSRSKNYQQAIPFLQTADSIIEQLDKTPERDEDVEWRESLLQRLDELIDVAVVMIDDAQTYFEQADACDLSNIPKSILEE